MNKGFSLVELIVVIAIMAILVGVAVPTYTHFIGKAQDGVDNQLVKELDRAIEITLSDPTVKSTGITTVTVAADGTISTNLNGTGDVDFIAAVNAIMPTSKISFKGTTYASGVVFNISGNSADVSTPASA